MDLHQYIGAIPVAHNITLPLVRVRLSKNCYAYNCDLIRVYYYCLIFEFYIHSIPFYALIFVSSSFFPLPLALPQSLPVYPFSNSYWRSTFTSMWYHS